MAARVSLIKSERKRWFSLNVEEQRIHRFFQEAIIGYSRLTETALAPAGDVTRGIPFWPNDS
jgi:hypothetical protein